MADTIRSKTELLALLADNTTGDISPQDMRDILVSLMGVYGEMLIVNSSTAQTGITTTPELMTGWTKNGVSNGVTLDYLNNQITVLYNGVYSISLGVSFSGTLNTEFLLHLRVDGVEQDEGLHRVIGTGGDVGSAGFTALKTLTAGQILTIYVASDDAGGSSFTPVDAQLRVVRVG